MSILSSVEKIIVHAGSCHDDEIVAISLALATMGYLVDVFRRDPTPEELNNPNVLVMDVGGIHNPSDLCFDHHQLARDAAPTNAASLLVDALGLTKAFELQGWWASFVELDSKGPFAVAKTLGLESFPFALQSPLGSALKNTIANMEEIPEPFLQVLMEMGQQLINEAKSLASDLEAAKASVHVLGHQGITINVWDSALSSAASTAFRDQQLEKAGVLVCRDDRGPGWTLYRYDDHERVDFSILAGRDNVTFAHAGGFICKTAEMTMLQALNLARLAISPTTEPEESPF